MEWCSFPECLLDPVSRSFRKCASLLAFLSSQTIAALWASVAALLRALLILTQLPPCPFPRPFNGPMGQTHWFVKNTIIHRPAADWEKHHKSKVLVPGRFSSQAYACSKNCPTEGRQRAPLWPVFHFSTTCILQHNTNIVGKVLRELFPTIVLMFLICRL